MKDKNLKTQICFKEMDIGIFTKTRGTDEPFSECDLEDILKLITLPKIDLTVSWKKKVEIPNMRRSSRTIRNVELKSLGGSKTRTSSPSPDRQPSYKRSKQSLSAESSYSGSDSSPSKGQNAQSRHMETSQ